MARATDRYKSIRALLRYELPSIRDIQCTQHIHISTSTHKSFWLPSLTHTTRQSSTIRAYRYSTSASSITTDTISSANGKQTTMCNTTSSGQQHHRRCLLPFLYTLHGPPSIPVDNGCTKSVPVTLTKWNGRGHPPQSPSLRRDTPIPPLPSSVKTHIPHRYVGRVAQHAPQHHTWNTFSFNTPSTPCRLEQAVPISPKTVLPPQPGFWLPSSFERQTENYTWLAMQLYDLPDESIASSYGAYDDEWTPKRSDFSKNQYHEGGNFFITDVYAHSSVPEKPGSGQDVREMVPNNLPPPGLPSLHEQEAYEYAAVQKRIDEIVWVGSICGICDEQLLS